MSQSVDRRRRHEDRLRDAGWSRLSIWVPPEQLELFKVFRIILREAGPQNLAWFQKDLLDYWHRLEQMMLEDEEFMNEEADGDGKLPPAPFDPLFALARRGRA